MKTSGLAKFAPRATSTAKVAFDEETFVVSDTADAQLFSGITGTFTKGAALDALAHHLNAHPEDAGRLQVIPAHEASTP